MEIKSFRIKNYRSIKDSCVCYMSGDNITILAGKNESGKTAILEALEDFNTDKKIRKEALPIQNEEAKPEIAVTFEIHKEALNEIFKEINVEVENNESSEIEIIKKYPNAYLLSEDSITMLDVKCGSRLEILQNETREMYGQIKELHQNFPEIGGTFPEINFDEISNFKVQLKNFRKTTRPNFIQILGEENGGIYLQVIEEIISKTIEIERFGDIWVRFINQIKRRIPHFILFSAFDDIFPSEIPLNEAFSDELIKDLATISDLDLEMIKSGSNSSKTRHKKQLNLKLKKDYKEFWTQDLTNIHIDWDSEKLLFFIEESEHYYPPKMRSKGKQWHLAFYVRVSARAREDRPNIILIDEPGLFLHAKAQKDILKRLEHSADKTPIVISTHSPYLIKTDGLSRIRLISKTSEDKGTVISNKIHKGADKETLTPIITAIGLDLSMGLDIAKDNNIIVEGITDYYFLSAFKEILKFEFKKELHFIPSAGADKINFLVPLMVGWGLNYCVVLDNDEKGRKTKKKLIENYGHVNIKTIFVSENKDEEIEDLFEREDFIKHILSEELIEVPTDKKNSQILKQKDMNYDKVLLSKLFFEKINGGNIAISQDTKKNFENLFRNIDELMFLEV